MEKISRRGTPELFRNFMPPLPQANLIKGWGDNALSKGAYAQTSILTVNERRAMEDAKVAGGEIRKAGVNAFHAIRSGDKARAKEVARQKLLGAQGLDKTNAILDQIHGAVTGITDDFQ